MPGQPSAEVQQLSVIVLTGANRASAQQTLEDIAQQTIREKIQLVVVDFAPLDVADLDTRGLRCAYLRHPEFRSLARGKAAGIRASHSGIVAFIENHCRPSPEWAEKVLAAFSGPWTAIGYAFVNGSPDSYRSRAALLADYAPWAYPVNSGECRHMPGNNIAYRKEFLDSLEPDLGRIFGEDFNVHEILLERGGKMYVEAEAIAAHQCFESWIEVFAANFAYVRVLAATRARNQAWRTPKRVVAALAALVLVPPLRFWRLLRTLPGRKGMAARLAASLPVLLPAYYVCAVAESAGYAFGGGDAEERLLYWELDRVRESTASTPAAGVV